MYSLPTRRPKPLHGVYTLDVSLEKQLGELGERKPPVEHRESPIQASCLRVDHVYKGLTQRLPRLARALPQAIARLGVPSELHALSETMHHTSTKLEYAAF